MKNFVLFLMLISSLFLVSCSDDDNNTNPTPDKDAIVGKWVCEGSNVPFGLRTTPFKVVKIEATFNENKSYTVVQTDSSNTSTTLTGTYTFTETTYSDTVSSSITKNAKIYNIVATQATPAAITAMGIVAISGNNMTYEVIQTTPAIAGVTAPTAAGGFGSTKIGGTATPIYIQKYVKVQ